MKTTIFKGLLAIGILILLFSANGCALYGSEKQYDSGDNYWLAGSEEMARIKQDKLAIEKLRVSSVQTAEIDLSTGEVVENNPLNTFSHKPVSPVSAGYKGIVANLGYKNANFEILGPETNGYFLSPDMNKIDYLLPGNYIANVYSGGRKMGSWKFKVSSKQFYYMGQQVHWYVYWDP